MINVHALQNLRRVVTGLSWSQVDESTHGTPFDLKSKASVEAWTARDPWFEAQGYFLGVFSRPVGSDGGPPGYYYLPVYKGLQGIDAGRKFFGLDSDCYQSLFGPPQRTKAKTLAAIDGILADMDDEPKAA